MVTNSTSFIQAKAGMTDIGNGTQAFVAIPDFPLPTLEMQLPKSRDAFLARKDLFERKTGPFGAVILGHERYGLVQHTLDLAAKFASYGYVAIAPDMASHWDGDKAALNRGEIPLTIGQDEITQYMEEGLDHLLKMPEVDQSRIVAMGVCASGSYPLWLNAMRSEVKANICVYGGQGTAPDIIQRITAPVLGIWGEADFVCSVDAVRSFRLLLEDNLKSYEFVLYRDMPHGWLNDTMPGRYRPRQSDQAWLRVIDFIDRVFADDFDPERITWEFKSNISRSYNYETNVRWE